MFIDLYFTSDSSEAYHEGEKAGLEGKALEEFRYAGKGCYKLTFDVNETTGAYKLIGFIDRVISDIILARPKIKKAKRFCEYCGERKNECEC